MSSTPLQPRITARVNAETQLLLTQAAAITGVSSINSFVLSAAIEKAKQVIAAEQILKLSQRDALLLMDALDEPPKINVRLQRAIENYQGSGIHADNAAQQNKG